MLRPSPGPDGQGRALKAKFGGDAVQNIDRLMRVPGTVNWPSPAKQARDQPPRLATVYGEFLYDLVGSNWPPPLHRREELARWLPPVTAPTQVDNNAGIAAVQAEIDLSVAQNGPLPDLLPRLFDAAKRNPALLGALAGDIKGKDTSSSAHRAAVVARLRAAGTFTPTDYAALVFSLPHCQGDRDTMPEEWWGRQLARDWVNVGKSHDPATWFQVLDNDPEGPEGDEPGPDSAAAVRINGSFDILRRGDITPWIGCEPVPVPFVIGDFVEQGAVTLLAGEGGAGKSYVALTAALAVAMGTFFYGKTTRQGQAVCLFAEDSPEALHIRLVRLCGATGVDMGAVVSRLLPVSLLDDPPENRVLWSGGVPTALLAVLEHDLAALPDLRLLVLDNVALMFDGEEISRKEVSGFLTALTRMARRLKIGIILIHHASKSQDGISLRMASGSTAWIAQSRVAAEVRKATDTDSPRLAVRKINNGREWEIDLHWTDEGTLVPIARVAAASNPIVVFLACLAAVTHQGQWASASKNSTYYAPKLFARMPEAHGLRNKALEKAMEALFAFGTIMVCDVWDSLPAQAARGHCCRARER